RWGRSRAPPERARRARMRPGRSRRRPRTRAREASRPDADAAREARSPAGARALGVRLGDEVGREAAQLAARQARAHVDALLPVLTLVDRRSERVELGELPALGVRQEEPNRLDAVTEARREAPPQLIEPLSGERRDVQRPWEAIGEASSRERVDGV